MWANFWQKGVYDLNLITRPATREASLEKQLKEKDEIISKLRKALEYALDEVDCRLCTICFHPVITNGRDQREFVCHGDDCDIALCSECIYEHREKIIHFDRIVEYGDDNDLCVDCLGSSEEKYGYAESQTPDDIKKQIRKVLKMDEGLDGE